MYAKTNNAQDIRTNTSCRPASSQPGPRVYALQEITAFRVASAFDIARVKSSHVSTAETSELLGFTQLEHFDTKICNQ